MNVPRDPLLFDILEGNVELLAKAERLANDKRHLEQVDQRKTEFLAQVSDDLRTPLNSIIGFSELLLDDSGSRPLSRRQADYVDAIHRNGLRLLTLINELLDLASLESGRMTLRLEDVSLAVLLDDLRAASEPVLGSGFAVEWPRRESLTGHSVRLDRRRVCQVLGNMVDNARKFTPAGGRIAIAMRIDAGRAILSVSDSGPGIPDSDRERIFSAYFQRQPGSGAGVGLGLTIVRGITALHGGTVALDSIPGRGATFSVSLPVGGPFADHGRAAADQRTS
ncbi:MAG: HAMP domain-containing histidine kinase [Planctomycetes bacterium]|nr:HAMP domain-containing histidine kinase [Planctomycetota bacterium]